MATAEPIPLRRLNRAIGNVGESIEWVLELAEDVDASALVDAAESLQTEAERLEEVIKELRHMALVEEVDDENKEEPEVVEIEQAEEEEGVVMAAGQPRPCCMISSHSTFRTAWDLTLALLLVFLVLVEPLELAYLPASAGKSHMFIGAMGIFIDSFFVADVFLNFRTGYTPHGSYVEVFDPKRCRDNYLRTWFTLDFVSSFPSIIDWVLIAVGSSSGNDADGLSSAKILKLGRVVKVIKVLRVAKLAKLSQEEGAVSDFIEDTLSSESSVFVVRIFVIIGACMVLAHLVACFMAASGDGWFKGYNPYEDDDETAEDWNWQRRYVVGLYYAFTTLTTVGYGDVTPRSTGERWFAIAAMLLGVAFYSYIIATVASMVQARDAKSAVYYEKMGELTSWMRHYKFSAKLRRRTRAFFKNLYAERPAIDEKAILENLAPTLQDQVSKYLLDTFVKEHPLFRELPEGVLWRVHFITRTITFDEGTLVAKTDAPSLGLYILRTGKAEATWPRKSRGPLARTTLSSHPSRRNAESARDAPSEIDGSRRLRQDDHRAMLRPGSSFGELCLLGTVTRSLVTVTTRERCEFFVIQRDSFLDAFSNVPEVLKGIMQEAVVFEDKPVWHHTLAPTAHEE